MWSMLQKRLHEFQVTHNVGLEESLWRLTREEEAARKQVK